MSEASEAVHKGERFYRNPKYPPSEIEILGICDSPSEVSKSPHVQMQSCINWRINCCYEEESE